MDIDIHVRCVIGGETRTVTADAAGIQAWRGGELIQRALPDMPIDDRELLVTKVCPDHHPFNHTESEYA